MATDLIMPTLPGGDSSQARAGFPQRPHHIRSQSYQLPRGPQISPLSTSDHQQSSHHASTPSSPRSSYHARQLRPLYIPAALRPNEFPSRRNTRKTRGTDSGTGTPDSSSESDYTLRRSSNSFVGVNSLAGLGQRLSRQSTGETGKPLDAEWDLDLFPPVTSCPTRDHWKPDGESSVCDDPTCKRTFTYFTRRHHCRKCGNIFCDPHSSFVVPLDQDANFNPRASPSRTCNYCFDLFRVWHSTNNNSNSQLSSSASSSETPHTVPSTPITAQGPGKNTMLPDMARSPDIAASVPRDWNWSTF